MAKKPTTPTVTKSGYQDGTAEAAEFQAANQLAVEDQEEKVLEEKEEQDSSSVYYHRELF